MFGNLLAKHFTTKKPQNLILVDNLLLMLPATDRKPQNLTLDQQFLVLPVTEMQNQSPALLQYQYSLHLEFLQMQLTFNPLALLQYSLHFKGYVGNRHQNDTSEHKLME